MESKSVRVSVVTRNDTEQTVISFSSPAILLSQARTASGIFDTTIDIPLLDTDPWLSPISVTATDPLNGVATVNSAITVGPSEEMIGDWMKFLPAMFKAGDNEEYLRRFIDCWMLTFDPILRTTRDFTNLINPELVPESAPAITENGISALQALLLHVGAPKDIWIRLPVEQQRRLAAVAVEMWRRKGTSLGMAIAGAFLLNMTVRVIDLNGMVIAESRRDGGFGIGSGGGVIGGEGGATSTLVQDIWELGDPTNSMVTPTERLIGDITVTPVADTGRTAEVDGFEAPHPEHGLNDPAHNMSVFPIVYNEILIGDTTYVAPLADDTNDGTTYLNSEYRTFGISVREPNEAPDPIITITTNSLSSGMLNNIYRAQLQANGGTEPYVWSVSSGALPGGISLNSSTGALTGTPTAIGSFSFEILVTAQEGVPYGVAKKSFVISIIENASGTLSILTEELPSGVVGMAYGAVLMAGGGTPPYEWTLTIGALPSGVALSENGVLSGTCLSEGPTQFQVTVTDAVLGTASKTFFISVIRQIDGFETNPDDIRNPLVPPGDPTGGLASRFSFVVELGRQPTAEEEILIRTMIKYMKPSHTHLAALRVVPT